MSAELRRSQCCVGRVEGDWGDFHSCLRPARELGGYCTTCWRGLSPESRALLRWEAGLDVVVRGEVRLLTPAEYAARENANAAREALIASEMAAGMPELDAWREGPRQPTEPIDALELWAQLPTFDPEAP